MKRLFALVAFLLASTAAQAQYTFEYGGRTIHVDPDRGTVSIPGVYDNSGRRKRAHKEQSSDHARKQTPQQAKVEPQAHGSAQPDSIPAPSVTPTNALPDTPGAAANVVPTENSML